LEELTACSALEIHGGIGTPDSALLCTYRGIFVAGWRRGQGGIDPFIGIADAWDVSSGHWPAQPDLLVRGSSHTLCWRRDRPPAGWPAVSDANLEMGSVQWLPKRAPATMRHCRDW
jgi:hypothetical protein